MPKPITHNPPPQHTNLETQKPNWSPLLETHKNALISIAWNPQELTDLHRQKPTTHHTDPPQSLAPDPPSKPTKIRLAILNLLTTMILPP